MERGACTATNAVTSCFSSLSLVFNRDAVLTAKETISGRNKVSLFSKILPEL
jgi:hypothetical protein